MDSKILLAAMAALMLALSGCTEAPQEPDADPGEGSTQDPITDPVDPVEPPVEEDEVVIPDPITGTVSGIADCALLGAGGPQALMGSSQPVPSDAEGLSYALESGVGTLPAGAVVCLYIDGASAASSGDVPEGAAQFQLYADGAPDGVSYTITFS